MEISIKWNVCRVCLKEEPQKCASGTLRHIFHDTKLAKQIYDCSGVLIKPNDSLPEKICLQCLTGLRQAYHFRTTCRNSDEYLQSIMQKTRSATSLFQQDKRREETLEFDDVVDEIFEEEEFTNDVSVKTNDPPEDAVTEKRKREPIKPTSEQLPGTKKNKVGTNVTKPTNNTVLLSISCSKTLSEVGNIENLKKLGNMLNQKTVAAASDSSGQFVDDTYPSVAHSTSSLCVLRSVLSTIPEIKNESFSKTSSALSVVDTYALDEEDSILGNDIEEHASDEEVEDDQEFVAEEKGIKTQAKKCALTKKQLEISHDKPLVVDEILAASEEDDFRREAGEELFYIINQDIKSETNHYDDSIEMNPIEFVGIDDETNAEFNTMENVEFLVDVTDEQSQSELELKRSSINSRTKSKERSKQHLLQKRKAGIDLHVCDVCGNNFTNKHLLNFHMKIHRNEKSYECELCFKRFNAACNLTAHMRIHTGEKPFECQFCGRKFADRSSHIKHERIHTNEKPYKCSTCGKAFSLSTSLKAHEKIHTGEKPYKCETCLKSFKLPHQLKAHLNTHLHKLLS